MGDGRFDDLEMAVMVLNPLMMKRREVSFTFNRHVFMPVFTNLLQQQVPFGVDVVTTGRVRPEITQRIARQGPPFQKPPAGFPIRTADPLTELSEERLDRQPTVHGPQERGAHSVQPDHGQIFIKRRHPPFIRPMLVDHQVRHPPRSLLKNVALQGKRLKRGNAGGGHSINVGGVGIKDRPVQTGPELKPGIGGFTGTEDHLMKITR